MKSRKGCEEEKAMIGEGLLGSRSGEPSPLQKAVVMEMVIVVDIVFGRRLRRFDVL